MSSVRRSSTYIAFAALLTACGESTAPLDFDNPPPADTSDVLEVGTVNVVDAANGGNPGFYFLPPLVAQPDSVGTFAANLSHALTVEICALTDDECDGEPIVVFDSEPNRRGAWIRVDEDDDHYIVNWHTRDFNLEVDSLYRIRLMAWGEEEAYADLRVLPKGTKPSDGDEEGGIPFGRTLPIKFYVDEGAVDAFAVSVNEVTDIKPLLFGIQVNVEPDAAVAVEYWTGDEPRLRVESPPQELHDVLLGRLLSDTTYQYEVLLDFGDLGIEVDPISGAFATDTLPDDLKALGLTSTGQSTSPLTMISSRDPVFRGFVAVDSKGRPVWYHRTGGASWGWTKRANGNFAFLDTGDGLNEVTPTGDVVATLPRADGEVIHHDVIATPWNTLYFMSRHPQAVNGTTWVGEIIWEWNPDTDELVERWNAHDFLSPDTDTTSRSRTGDWIHGNSLHIGPTGNVLLSSPFLNQVIAITGDFTDLAWRLGGKNATIFTDSAGTFNFQHTAAQLSENRVLVFDNRGGSVDPVFYSRALEVEIDFDANTAAEVWSFRPPNDNYATIVSSARRMANGNTMVAFGTSDGFVGSHGPIEVYEVQPDGTIVWNLVIDGPLLIYRATPFDDIVGEIEVAE